MAKRKRIKGAIAARIGAADVVAADGEIARLRAELAAVRGRYKAALSQIDAERQRADALAGLAGIEAKQHKARARAGSRRSAATMIALLSDWHCEETVEPETVCGWNRYNLDVCDLRIAELTERFLALLAHERGIADIRRVVIWLGGDFISGYIHPELVESNSLSPLAACQWAGARMRGFIDAVSDSAESVVVATNCGNHGRTTDKGRIKTAAQNSFEHYLYLTLAAAEKRKNVEWRIGSGYLNYVDLDGFSVRFHHGHAVRSFGNGVGGITIPINKALSAWDKIQRADLTCMGHYHQFHWVRGNKLIVNGSLIGHSAFSTMIRASWEPPSQALAVVCHRRREVTRAYPVYVDRDLSPGGGLPCLG